MELKYANISNLKDGWVLSYDLLTDIQKYMEKNFTIDEIPSLEQIEAVLIAFKMQSKNE